MIILHTNAIYILTVCLNKNIRHVMSYIQDLLIKSDTHYSIDMHFTLTLSLTLTLTLKMIVFVLLSTTVISTLVILISGMSPTSKKD